MASTASAPDADIGTEQLSAAQKLMQKHSHQATVEDVPDEDDISHGIAVENTASSAADSSAAAPAPTPAPAAAGASSVLSWAPTPSAKSVGKQKAEEPALSAKKTLDTESHELFPELGGAKKPAAIARPIWGAKPAGGAQNGASHGNGTNGASNGASVASGTSTPSEPTGPAFTSIRPPPVTIPGQAPVHIVVDDNNILPRNALKRPIPDIIKDVNRRSRANVSMGNSIGGRRRFEATGPQEAAEKAIRDVIAQIGSKVTRTVAIPQSVRPHIIGKQGSQIKALQEKTGARIQLPRAEELHFNPNEDPDDQMINISIEGNVLSVAAAEELIQHIVNERLPPTTSSRLQHIPAEFYPFIADPNNSLIPELESRGVQVRVPPQRTLSANPPVPGADGRVPTFSAAPAGHAIEVTGDRAAVKEARAQIEQLARELQETLQVERTSVPNGTHQYIVGNDGQTPEQFLNETGCAVVFPTAKNDDMISIIGPADRVQAARDLAIDMATNVSCSVAKFNRVYSQVPGGAAAHALKVARYLRERKEIERLEKLYNTHIQTPFAEEDAMGWEVYSHAAKDSLQARNDIVDNIAPCHPPARFGSVDVDPFFHSYLRNEIQPNLLQSHGVFLVVPDAATEPDAPVLLVYEGPQDGQQDASSSVPRTRPSPADLNIFEQGIRDAQQHILDLISAQQNISEVTLEIPTKFHEKLRNYIVKLRSQLPPGKVPVSVANRGTDVILRGPEASVDELTAKITAFIAQATEEEKERGYTLTFDFPKAYANHLIGKGGSKIRELRDTFDVEIQVQDGKVELKGPKAKAEKARAHINSLAKHLADETTYSLRIEPKFHGELIGSNGEQINRLQSRYDVHIYFPRVTKASAAAGDDESVTDHASEAGKGRRQQAPDEVIVRGPKKGADGARDEIKSLYQYLKDNSHTATITVLQRQVPYFIGQGGSAMDALRQETHAKIDVPNGRGQPDSPVEILIRGTKEEVAAAKKVLEAKKAVLDDTVLKTIDVDKKYHKALIGSGGSHIRELVVKAGGSDDRRELSRTIQFPSQDSSEPTIKVEGRSAVVDNILKQIAEFVAERDSLVTETIDVPQDKHKGLIGRGGDTRRQTESKFHVTLDIPRQGSNKTEVKISGKPEDVAKAKEHIAGLVRDQHSVTVQVPRRFHHDISSNGQFFRRMRNDNQVTIDHAGQPVPPQKKPAVPKLSNGSGAVPLITDDEETANQAHSWSVVDNSSTEEGDIPWVLRGSPENVEKAQKALEKALAQAAKGNVTGYLVLPDSKHYRHIVGSGGKKIQGIRRQTGCSINVPQGGNTVDEPITVVGPEDGVEKARELMLAAVQEGLQQRHE